MITLKQIDNNLKTIFDESKVQLVDSTYELSTDEEYYKLVFSIHNVEVEKEGSKSTLILHTKFIFRTNKEKTEITENSFWYLKDINCKYVKINFESNDDLMNKLENIINENSFGDNIKSLSEFVSKAPSSSVNDFLFKNSIDSFSVGTINYNPSVKMTPCKDITFDFDISLNNGEVDIKLSIKKVKDIYMFYYYINDEVEEMESEYISDLPQLIGEHLQYLHNKYLK